MSESLEAALAALALALDQMDKSASPGSYTAPWATVEKVLDAARVVVQATRTNTVPTQPARCPP